MKEIRIHGRAGQGAWTAGNLLAMAAIKEGKFAQSFPEFGPERMGAPMAAFARIDENPIELHCGVYEPDCVLVLDPTLVKIVDVAEGTRADSKVIINTSKDIKVEGAKSFRVPASEIALRILGKDITNTAILGALLKVEPVIKIETLFDAIDERFSDKLAELNKQVIKEAYEKVEEI
ncbi:MAG: 2-oxoacid:acceptor oxidoreductase family protein [Candidatus Thermoplasmatota archaeon]|nr:2-oxoacid:acceptor oxidoreductase family protein [Candidatus Thermoplasmatota archaeon]